MNEINYYRSDFWKPSNRKFTETETELLTIILEEISSKEEPGKIIESLKAIDENSNKNNNFRFWGKTSEFFNKLGNRLLASLIAEKIILEGYLKS
jgi:hypothetical protein